ncbi:Oxoglutarate/iron-dependent dioxygenase [uncultured Caudovirales phage]|uniref:Oxoglutarate/iron-dependent dioxygenase n=1 Tax=uncultured Caudovirales phage TaxID=2100421 RepID=A0A6J7WVZ2_9CAUD|nr:Oxoglutarate/iron-dependent dioxygenase [uncultured Caudovirales phage]
MTQSIDQFLPKEIADELYDYVRKMKWSYGWHSNNGMGYAHWNSDIAKAPTANGLDISDRLSGVVLDAWNYIRETYLQDHILLRCYANSHTYGVEGYPHTDSRRQFDKTVVIYMNREWKREWGGETMVYEGSRIEHAELPAFNRALIFNGSKWHCARGVTRICPEQRRTIMFKAVKMGVDDERDNLQRLLTTYGANKMSHKNGSLQNHLLITYDLLKASGQAPAVCLAGGAHSVFGTNAYDKVAIDPALRNVVVDTIGLAATQLVELFGSIDRPKTLLENIGADGAVLRTRDGNLIAVNKVQLDALIMIECANLSEQNELHRHRKLQEHWRSRSRE